MPTSSRSARRGWNPTKPLARPAVFLASRVNKLADEHGVPRRPDQQPSPATRPETARDPRTAAPAPSPSRPTDPRPHHTAPRPRTGETRPAAEEPLLPRGPARRPLPENTRLDMARDAVHQAWPDPPYPGAAQRIIETEAFEAVAYHLDRMRQAGYDPVAVLSLVPDVAASTKLDDPAAYTARRLRLIAERHGITDTNGDRNGSRRAAGHARSLEAVVLSSVLSTGTSAATNRLHHLVHHHAPRVELL